MDYLVLYPARFDTYKTSGILSLRHKMWSAVSSRSHHPIKIFPFAPVAESETEVMLYGTVEYGLKEGGSDGKNWAARALLVNSGSEGEVGGLAGWRLKFYQVYLVSCYHYAKKKTSQAGNS